LNRSYPTCRVASRAVMASSYQSILWRFRTRSLWADVPNRYRPYTTCYNRFVRWRNATQIPRLQNEITLLDRNSVIEINGKVCLPIAIGIAIDIGVGVQLVEA
jgi:hypothetical protein